MNNLVCSVASYLVNSLWEVSLITGAGWLVSRWLRRLGSQVEHVVWVLTLVLSVVTPALPLWRWLLAFLYAHAGMNEPISIVFVAAESVKTNVRSVALLSPTFIEALVLLYVVTLLYFATRLSLSLYLTVKLRREACAILLQPTKEELWNRCRGALSVKSAMVLSSAQITGPVAIAFREPVLLLPRGFSEECNDDDFLAAIAHECAHLKRRDFQKNLFYEAVSLAIAFHPVTWFVKSQIAQPRDDLRWLGY
jgi:beta-lactamase regulating signal transducer with metallopeptidase domain